MAVRVGRRGAAGQAARVAGGRGARATPGARVELVGESRALPYWRCLATLKAELVEHERYATRAAAIASIGDYIDNFYNLKRRHSRLAYMSPIEFELKTYVTALTA
jgi:transposase InsO family protein